MDLMMNIADDILLAIFSNLIEFPYILPPAAGETCLTLMVVCRRWRYIILNSANRWTNLLISPTTSSNNFNADVKLGQCWLQLDIRRYSGYSLHLSLIHHRTSWSPMRTNTGTSSSWKEEVNVLENVLFPAARRLKSLSLTFCSNDAADSFFSIPPTRFYFLESIQICIFECRRSEMPPTAATAMTNSTLVTVFKNSPFLRQVSIVTDNGLNPLTLQLPWHLLARINLGLTTISPEVFLSILSKSSLSLSVGFFSIEFLPKGRTRYPNRGGRTRIFAAVLKHLRLRLINPSLDPDIFSRIHLPALVSFRVDLNDSNAGWTMKIYYPLLRNSTNTLEAIGFRDALSQSEQFEGVEGPVYPVASLRRNFPRMPQDLGALFSIFPKVRVLHLPTGLHITGDVAEMISQGFLLPRLEILEVPSCTGVDILTMIADRNELAYNRPELVGSSSAPLGKVLNGKFIPPFFLEVVLLTSIVHMERVERFLAHMRSHSSSQITAFTVISANPSFF